MMEAMQTIAAHCSWADAQLENDSTLMSQLPPELVSLIRSSTGSEYLEAVASATLLPQHTDRISGLYRPLLPEITARWLHRVPGHSFPDQLSIFSSIVKILPFAPYMESRVTALISYSQGLSALAKPDEDLSGLTEDQLLSILLAFFRLFTYDQDIFGSYVHPALLFSLFRHNSHAVRYLAIQCFSQVMHLADALSENLVATHIGSKAVLGRWDGKDIDFRIVKLLEERRWQKQEKYLETLEVALSTNMVLPNRMFSLTDISSENACLGGILVPRSGDASSSDNSLVSTPTTIRNLRSIGTALLDNKSILLTGQPGSGKTSLVLEAAKALNNLSSMITLHLNEQTDAKSLMGIYTTSELTGAFVWQPGVLTRAITEGRWLLIEDIDRAPAELLGIIASLLQEGELYIPSRKECIKARAGFRIFATIRTSGADTKSSLSRNAWILGEGAWNIVNVQSPQTHEVQDILDTKFPEMRLLNSTVLNVHCQVESEYRSNHALRSVQSKFPSLRDLLKWCRRISGRLGTSAVQHGGAMSESTKLDIFRDAVDCYAGYLSSESTWFSLASSIAEKMQIPLQQVQHCLKFDLPKISESKTSIKIGGVSLQKSFSGRRDFSLRVPFALTRQASLTMRSITAGVSRAEPVLLVGETGVGKTTLVQHIARLLGQSITVVNLSQQSEASDLLGGLKPVSTRSLMIPVAETFGTLFDETFSAKKNEKFISSIQRCVNRENWQRLLLLWQQALQMAEAALQVSVSDKDTESPTHAAKRRKLATPRYRDLRTRWTSFSQDLERLRVQADRTELQMTFAFVEGRLVHAVRNGEWLLLDEINLASPDTLDSIMSLLGGADGDQPFVHLTEAGSMERVIAHPNFRVFAAMNPATDIGKKELASGIRSRFTEMYVQPGDTDVADLIKLIEIYLGPLIDSDKRAAFDLANLYLEIKQLNQEHRLVDGAGDDPHFTVRSLVRSLLYVQQHIVLYGLRRAIYEGVRMSFCTMLSRDSERIMSPLIDQHILSSVKNARGLLAQTPKSHNDGQVYIPFKHHLVLKGEMDPEPQQYYIRTPSVERNLLNLARATSMRRFPILLQGPTSSGKTSMVEYLAKCTGNEFVRINNHEHTDLQEYLGSYASDSAGRLEYREGVLVRALRQGQWIVLDELNLAPSDVLEALNRLLDDNRELLIPESQEIVRPHPSFMLFATQNPAGLYGGRKRLSRAFRNRFLELHFDDIPEGELEVILQQRSQIPPSFCAQIVAVYKRLSLQRQSNRLFEQRNSFATLRDLFRWAARPADDRTQLAQQGFMLLGERVRDAVERQVVKATIEEVMRVKIDEPALYGLSEMPFADMSHAIVWTPAMRRLFVLVSKALKNNEPVLLIGETGCGKTQICQTVSEAFHQKLNVYNAHTNTETGDLIGSQRPVRRVAESGNLSLFEWVDGSLVQAMKQGQHFLLDEISLADDSVLERLNSLLEPSRTILLAEKGSTNNLVTAAPGFQFLATMNPGGDYGKRELSAALRNRLTEIWVPSLVQIDDIQPIIESSLSPGVRHFAPAMLQFAAWFRHTFQGADSGSVPLRDLLTWTEFVVRNLHLESNLAMCHGAAMVFIDSLGANPAGMVSSLLNNVNAVRQWSLQKLGSILEVEASPVYEEKLSLVISQDVLQISQFRLKREPGAKEVSNLVFEAPTTLKNTMRIVRALQMARPILIEGSPGVGKTAIVTALAHALGKRLTRINLSDQTDLMDLFGADVPVQDEGIGKFVWSDGPLLRAMVAGEWVLLDEMNLASQSVLEGLNSCLDHRREVFIAELGRTFALHPEFTMFAAQNPHQQGGGRKGLPKSFVNRFTVVYADTFEREDLYCICRTKFPEISQAKLQRVVDALCEVQKITEKDPGFGVGGPWNFNLRDLDRWLAMIKKNESIPPGNHFDTIISQRFRNFAQIDRVMAVREKAFPRSDRSSLYHTLSPTAYQIGTAFLQRASFLQNVSSKRCPIATEALQYAHSLIEAVNQKWPVILGGPPGSNPAALIRQLAAISGAHLTQVFLNSDIDTMDLVGGFEQYDPQSETTALKQTLLKILGDRVVDFLTLAVPSSELQVTLRLYCKCLSPEFSLQELRTSVANISDQTLETASLLERIDLALYKLQEGKPGFVWNSGILVDALRDGRWLILENANTCNPAVLDRLNSLLEPNGQLIISEQHTAAVVSTAIKRHPGFRIFLTMDPRHGELSQAMRNRSLEVYMEEIRPAKRESSALSYPCASNISRLRYIDTMDLTDVDANVHQELAGTFADHLSQGDRLILSPLALGSLEIEHKHVLQDKLRACSDLPLLLYERIRNFDDDMRHESGSFVGIDTPALFCVVSNEPTISLSRSKALRTQAITYSWIQKLFLDLSDIRHELARASDRATRLHGSHHNTLEISISVMSGSVRKGIAVLPFARFLTDLGLCLSNFLLEMLTVPTLSPVFFGPLKDMIAFGFDMLGLSHQFKIPSGVLPAYIQSGEQILKEMPKALASLRSALSSTFKLFDTQTELHFGHGLQRMWDSWRPRTASTNVQLRDLLKLEDIARRVDKISVAGSAVEQLGNVRLRLMQAFASTFGADAYGSELMRQMDQHVTELECAHFEQIQSSGHFAGSFRGLCQMLRKDSGSSYYQILSIFAKLPTALEEVGTDNQQIPRAFVAIIQSADLGSPDATWSGWRGSFSLIMAKELLKYEDQSISMLDVAQKEIMMLAKATALHVTEIGSSTIEEIRLNLLMITKGILASHSEFFKSAVSMKLASSEDSEHQLHSLVKLEHTEELFSDNVSPGHYFKEIFTKFLKPAIANLGLHTKDHMSALSQTGRALVGVSLASLRLLVPDRAYDPALLPQVNEIRYERRMIQLQNRLEALVTFQKRFTGRDTSLLIRMTEDELMEMGERPPATVVVRPETSELDNLQAEFTNLLQLIVMQEPERIFLSSDAESHREIHSDLETFKLESANLMQKTSQIVERLSHMNRTYDDIVRPIVWVLQTLRLGTQMIAAVESKSSRKHRSIQELVSRTPMLHSIPEKVIEWSIDQNSVSSQDSDTRYRWLDHFALKSAIEARSCSQDRAHFEFLLVVDAMYQEWKSHLERGQVEAVTRAKYYAYRGDDDVDELEEQHEFAQMFPTFEMPTDSPGPASEELGYDARATAIRMATLQSQIVPDERKDADMQNYLLRTMDILAAMVPLQGFELSPVLSEDLLPGLLLQLDHRVSELDATEHRRQINIYADGDLVEARRLLFVVQKTQITFRRIQTTWPEHAVPGEVLTCCSGLLGFSMKEPLAKWLTKTEKLYEFVGQWQAVASQEFSAAEEQDELAKLIIRWRTLELGSWSRLLDLEQKKFEENAYAWYFIVYEAVISNSMQILVEQGSAVTYLEELGRTLQEFFTTAGLGEFSFRIRLVQTFQRLLARLLQDDSRLQRVHDCVSNTINHHLRYVKHVREVLVKGRLELEKKIQDQVRLASWKDTNVNALRESARRSHHKLFKIVRKYRTLLGTPCGAPSPMELQESFTSINRSLKADRLPRHAVELALERSAKIFVNWARRPERFRNPHGAATRMRLLFAHPDNNFQADRELSQFRESLRTSMLDLRIQTPGKLTEENQNLVNHLKSVKQALLTDTLRKVKHMGIRRDLGTVEIESQSNVARILASTTTLESAQYPGLAAVANDAFHASLDLMPQVRNVLHEHSKEIRVADLRRGVSFMDGLLSLQIQQRRTVSAAADSLRAYNEKFKQLHTLVDGSVSQFQREVTGFGSKERAMRTRLCWLPELITLSCKILKIQANFANFDVSETINMLHTYSSRLQELLSQSTERMVLPKGICRISDLELSELISKTLQDMGSELEDAMEKQPQTGFILRKIIPWTTVIADGLGEPHNGSHYASLDGLDLSLCQCLDSIFSAIERVANLVPQLPNSSELPGWLAKTEKRLSQIADALQISQISTCLDSVLAKFAELNDETLSDGISLLLTSLPIFEQYFLLCQHVTEQLLALHVETAKTNFMLAKILSTLASEGFCGASAGSDAQEHLGPVESGTGFGEGQGSEDISKDVGGEEDLSELAQMETEKPDGEETEASKDAVNMDKDDLKGDDGNAADEDEQSDASSGSEEADESDLEEEAGSVDDLDSSAVDEKMWEGLGAEKDKEIENEKHQGVLSDQKTAAGDKKKNESEDQEHSETEDDVSDASDDGGGGEDVGKEETENADPNLREEKPLDLPDEMQLNGEENPNESDGLDDEMDELSDIEQDRDLEEEGPQVEGEESAEAKDEAADEAAGNLDDEDQEGRPDEDEIMEDQSELDEDQNHATRDDDVSYDADKTGDGENGLGGAPEKEQNPADGSRNQMLGMKDNLAQERAGSVDDVYEDRDKEETSGLARGGRSKTTTEKRQTEALKKLGDALDRWHQRRQILEPSDEIALDPEDDVDMADTEFEHLQNEEDIGDAQALGTASKEQAQTLDMSKFIEDEDMNVEDKQRLPKTAEEEQSVQENMMEHFSRLQTDLDTPSETTAGIFVVKGNHDQQNLQEQNYPEELEGHNDQEADVEDLLQAVATTREPLLPLEEASQLWALYSAKVQNNSLFLTEQLRLILAPTLATKLRGDFRTGKRLNIKRIIPYIASQYKRDKIWMRRSVPSKRNYQIMLALDDSKSMMEGSAGALAFETLAMLCKSLSMLEVGDLCVVGFGNEEHIRIAHSFGQPFGNEAGVKIFQNFTFNQTATDMKNMVAESITLFQDARAKATGSQSELWQLQLIISDGICEDHEEVGILVRRAKEERIMIVFVIVDSVNGGGSSILDLTQAQFEPDENQDGEMKLMMRNYLERFPFPYYLVVRDVRDLPGVLATALKGWFAQVVDVEG